MWAALCAVALLSAAGTAERFSLRVAEEAAPAFELSVVRQEQRPARRVLVYHTHSYEAYAQQPDAPYAQTEQWRTADDRYNVRRVGEELCALLNALGIEAVHDPGVYEPPELNTAYLRSLEMLERRKAAGERYDLYIDLHRDAYTGAGGDALTLGGASVARLMLLVGKGEGYAGTGYGERPRWNLNLAVAENITDALNAQASGLCRDVCVKSGRFNQHVADACVLVEVGHNRNTLAEALAAMPYLADAIRDALGGA